MVIPLIFPNVPQASLSESSGFPSYPLPLQTPPLKNPIIRGFYPQDIHLQNPNRGISSRIVKRRKSSFFTSWILVAGEKKTVVDRDPYNGFV